MDAKNKMKIFLVDDDKLFVSALKYKLSKDNAYLEIKTFPTGEECVQNLHQNPSLIILDYRLNGNYPEAIDGIEVLKKIKRRAPDTAVIMLSSQDNIEVAINSLKGGAFDYLTKSENSFIKLKKIIGHLSYEIAYSENADKEERRMSLLSLSVALLIITLFLINRILS